jgi:hypothetical protein
MTDADSHRKKALAEKAAIADLNARLKTRRESFRAAIYDMEQAGMTGAQIARELEVSDSFVRDAIKTESLKRGKSA